MASISIFLTNLGKYNEGHLIGEWLALPASDEEISAVLERIGINEQYEEYFITDYESEVSGLTVGEYDNIEELNELAEVLEDNAETAEALIYWGYDSAEEISAHLDDVCYICTPEGFESDEYAIGWHCAKEMECLEIPENIESYFDFESYGRDIMLDGQFYTAEDGSIYEFIG